MIRKAVKSILAASVGVTSIVSKRIYADFAPQGATLPFIVFKTIAATRVDALTKSSGLVDATVMVELFSRTVSQLVTLSGDVRAALYRYNGTAGGVKIQGTELTNEFSDDELEVAGGDRRIRRQIMDFSIWYEEMPIAVHS